MAITELIQNIPFGYIVIALIILFVILIYIIKKLLPLVAIGAVLFILASLYKIFLT